MDKLNIPSIIDRIDFLLKQRGQKREDLAKFIGKNKQVFTDWKNRNISPTAQDLYYMAKWLGTSYDYLLIGKSYTIPDDVAVATSLISSIPENKREPLIEFIAKYVQKYRELEKDSQKLIDE